jgi:hypothetical protein
MADAKAGDLVQIHSVILQPEERATGLPDSTGKVPYECWLKGFLIDDAAKIGDVVTIKTFIGRELTGTLAAVGPAYEHGFGRPRPELLPIGSELFRLLGRD